MRTRDTAHMPRFAPGREQEIRSLFDDLKVGGRSVVDFADDQGVAPWSVYLFCELMRNPSTTRCLARSVGVVLTVWQARSAPAQR